MNINSMVCIITATVFVYVCFSYLSPDNSTSLYIQVLCVITIACTVILCSQNLHLPSLDDIQQKIHEADSISDSITSDFVKIINSSKDDLYD